MRLVVIVVVGCLFVGFVVLVVVAFVLFLFGELAQQKLKLN